MKKKVLFVINTLGHAGAEVALLELLNHMDRKKYEIYLYVLLGQGEMFETLPADVHILNDSYSSESVLSKSGRKQMRRNCLHAILKKGHRIQNLHYIFSQFCQMKKRGTVQIDKLLWRVLSDGGKRLEDTFDLAVAYLEGGSTYYVAEHVKARKKAAFVHIDYGSTGYSREMDQGCYDKMDRIFTVSDEVKKHFLEFYPEYEAKTEVFHNLIDQEKIRIRSEEAGGFKDAYDGFRILTVGRLNPQKGYEIAVNAMKKIMDSGAEARWYVLGEGQERKKLELQIQQLGLERDFILCGAVENPYPYYRQADLYVHATRFEGKSIAIQEAQTLGCAILASDCNGNREQIEHGVDGLLCELDADKIAQQILQLMYDPERRQQMGNAAKEKVLSGKEDMQKLLQLADKDREYKSEKPDNII